MLPMPFSLRRKFMARIIKPDNHRKEESMRHHIVVIVCLLAAKPVLAGQAQAPRPQDVQLVGDRFKPLKWDEMTPPQKTMMEHLVSGERRGAGGPFNVLLRSPEMGDLAQQFGASMRFHSSLPRKLNEM